MVTFFHFFLPIKFLEPIVVMLTTLGDKQYNTGEKNPKVVIESANTGKMFPVGGRCLNKILLTVLLKQFLLNKMVKQ